MKISMEETAQKAMTVRHARSMRRLACTLAGSLALTSGVVMADGMEEATPVPRDTTSMDTPRNGTAGAGMGGAGSGTTDPSVGGTGAGGTEPSGAGMGGTGTGTTDPSGAGMGGGGTGAAAGAAGMSAEHAVDATRLIGEATQVLRKMQTDPEVRALLQRAVAVFVVPDYGRAGLIVGGKGGAGVLVAKRAGNWESPIFYNIGGINIGAQAGVAVGPVAMLLMNDNALKRFRQVNNFSLEADAALAIVNYSTRAQGFTGKGDVIVWSDTKGAYAGANVGVLGIRFDRDKNRAYYNNQTVSPEAIMSGKVKGPTTGTAQIKELHKSLGG